MPRSREDLAKAAADAEAWLDSLDPETTPAEDPADLRRIGLALRAAADAEADLQAAVDAARANGRSWSRIGMVLGISKQAAQQRYGRRAEPADARPSAG